MITLRGPGLSQWVAASRDSGNGETGSEQGFQPFVDNETSQCLQQALVPRVLVAEDDPANMVMMRAIFERMGCIVDTVSDGHDAVRAALSTRYTLVCMDVTMPGMPGDEAVRLIRSNEKHTGDGMITPIVAFSGHAQAEAREKLLAAGVDDYVTKPVRLDTLQELLQRYFDVSA